MNLVTIRSLERKLAIESEEKEKLSSEVSFVTFRFSKNKVLITT